MKIALIGDSHFDSGPSGRMEECVRVHDWMADDMAERGVDLCLHGGDIFERTSKADERNAVRAWVQKVADFCPFLIVRGNHTPRGQLDIFSRLRAHHEIIVEEGACVHVIGGVVVGCLAWPSKASVLAACGPVSMEQGEQTAADALRHVLRGLDGEMSRVSAMHGADGAPRIVLAHAMVSGSITSTGQPLIGTELTISTSDLRLANADFYGLAHVHRHQSFTDGHGDIVYPGSPRRTAYGEVEDKGYVIVECDGHDVSWEFVKTPCTPMVLIESTWDEMAGEFPDMQPRIDGGADIRFRYTVQADHRKAAGIAADRLAVIWKSLGATNVTLEPRTVTVSTVKAPEVAEALGTPAKIRAMWKLRGLVVSPKREDEIMSKLDAIEQELS